MLQYISLVYGSHDPSLRKDLFLKLNQNDLNIRGAWVTTGDYNSVLSREGVANNTRFSLNRSAGFSSWIFREGLIDLGYKGPKFTWSRGTETSNYKAARLDRALCNIDWKFKFLEAEVTHLPRVSSDQSPILITTNATTRGVENRSFKFNVAWLTHPEFLKVVGESWNTNAEVEENKITLAQRLSEWNKNSFGNIFQRKRRVLARLQGIQRNMCTNPRPDLMKLEKKLRKEFEEILSQEELLWFQRS